MSDDRQPSPSITGYRKLAAEEVATINDIKAEAQSVGTLVEDIAAKNGADPRWIAIAKTDLQKGFMSQIRSVARPETF